MAVKGFIALLVYRFSPPNKKTELKVFLRAEICRQCRGKLEGEILEAPIPAEETAASAASVTADPGLCEESGLCEKPQEGNIKEVRLTCCLFREV